MTSVIDRHEEHDYMSAKVINAFIQKEITDGNERFGIPISGDYSLIL